MTATVLVSWLAWRYLYRWWMVQGDDFLFLSIGRSRGGRFTARQWVDALRYDWFDRLGRMADSTFRLLLRPGAVWFRWEAPTLLALLGLALWRMAVGIHDRDAADGPRRPTRVAAWLLLVLALGALPVAMLTVPSLAGDMVFWADSFVNYVPPTAGVLAVGAGLASRLEGRRPRAGTTVVVSLLALWTPLQHECASFSMLALVVGSLVLARGRLPRNAWPVALCGAAAALAQLTSPGLRVRGGETVTATSGEKGVVLFLHHGANAAELLVQVNPGAWAAVLVLATARAAVRGIRPLVPGIALAWLGASLVSLAWVPWQGTAQGDRGYHLALDARGAVVAAVLVAGFSLLLVGVFHLLFASRRDVGVRPVLSFGAMLAASAPVVVSGVGTPRAYAPSALWLWATLLALLASASARRWLQVVVVGVAAATMTGASAAWWVEARVALAENQRAMQPTLYRLQEKLPNLPGRPGGARWIGFPAELPHPDYVYYRAFTLKRYGPFIRFYYDLPDDIRLVQERPGQLGGPLPPGR